MFLKSYHEYLLFFICKHEIYCSLYIQVNRTIDGSLNVDIYLNITVHNRNFDQIANCAKKANKSVLININTVIWISFVNRVKPQEHDVQI